MAALQPLQRSAQAEQKTQSGEHLHDALSFLAMEKAFGPDDDSSKEVMNVMRGVDAAELAAAAKDTQGMWRGIGKDALDKVAQASKSGTLTSLTNAKEDFEAMEAIRRRQVQISHKHMAFDVVHDSLDTSATDFSSKDFLSKFQQGHAHKEKDLHAITVELESLAKDIGSLHQSKAGFKMPSDPVSGVGNTSSQSTNSSSTTPGGAAPRTRMLMTDMRAMDETRHGGTSTAPKARPKFTADVAHDLTRTNDGTTTPLTSGGTSTSPRQLHSSMTPQVGEITIPPIITSTGGESDVGKRALFQANAGAGGSFRSSSKLSSPTNSKRTTQGKEREARTTSSQLQSMPPDV